MALVLATHGDVYAQLWSPLNAHFTAMERRGFGVDLDFLARTETRAQADELALGTEIAAGVEARDWPCGELNWRSPVALPAFLYTELGLNLPVPPVWAKGPGDGKPHTDGVALTYLADHNPEHAPLIRAELRRRKIQSSRKYLKKLALFGAADGRVHCRIKRDTETGRQSVCEPELQQIPADPRKDPYDIRRGFVARPGYTLISADYSQLEMRILAHLLILLFRDDTLAADIDSGDCHSKNALRVFAPLRPYLAGVRAEDMKEHADPRIAQCRDDIKAVIYGLNYGKSDYGFGASLRDELGDPIGRAAAKKVIDGLFKIYPAIPKFHAWVAKFVKDHGFIPTLLGRIRQLLNPGSKRAWRQALNTPMQGGGADIMDLALLSICESEHLARLGAEPLLPVHDEIILEVPTHHTEEACAVTSQLMQNAYQLRLPLRVGVTAGPTWAG